MSNRVNVEEVFEAHNGLYFGMESGKIYSKDEVEEIGPFCWSKPQHGADVNELDTLEDDQDKDFEKTSEVFGKKKGNPY